MALKGKKFNNYSDKLRNEIISKYISSIPSSRLEKEHNIPQKTIRNWKKNKNERIEDNVKPNLVKRNFNTNKKNTIWCTDITYLIFKASRAYLSTIIYLYDRKVVSYKISKHNDNKLVLKH